MEPPTFEAVLDRVCERLWDKKVQYSIRRIAKMDSELAGFEKELDELIGRKIHHK